MLYSIGMITKSDLVRELGSASALAAAAGVSKQAVSQWGEQVPLESAIRLAQTGRWSLQDLRPDKFTSGDKAA